VFLHYKPEGQPERRFHVQLGRMHSGEMIQLERHTGLKYGPFKQELMQAGTIARQGLLWLLLHRDHPELKFADVGFYDDELELVMDKDEVAKEIEALEDLAGSPELPEADRLAGLAMLRSQLREAPDAPGKAPESTLAAPTTPGIVLADALTPLQPPGPLNI
jgi:hypothetical protein